MSIENYKAEPIEGHDDNYIGYVSHTTLAAKCTAFYEQTFPTYTASVQVGEETYYRCGAFKAKVGTRVTLEEFVPYYEKFGTSMLTEDALRAAVSAVQGESEVE